MHCFTVALPQVDPLYIDLHLAMHLALPCPAPLRRALPGMAWHDLMWQARHSLQYIAFTCPTIPYLTLHHTTYILATFIYPQPRQAPVHVGVAIYLCNVCIDRYEFKCTYICTQMHAGVPVCTYMSDAARFNIDYVSKPPNPKP